MQQIQTIQAALKLIPDLTLRQAALEALQVVAATLEVQDARILQLNANRYLGRL